MPDSLVRYFHMGSKDLVYLKFILEAYEGLATLSTEDAKKGIIRISVPCELNSELDKLLHALLADISFSEIFPPLLLPLENQPCCEESCHA